MSLTDAIADLATTNVLLVALDFDGTLAPLVDDPLRSRMTPAARAALTTLAGLDGTYVALVSGRALSDLRAVSEFTPESRWFLFASHGAEAELPAGWLQPAHPEGTAAVARHADALRAMLEDLPGVRVELKRFGFVVHTRLADGPATAAADALTQVYAQEHLRGWRVRGGHDVVEFAERPEGKDVAITALRGLLSATAVLFAGDDVTDEDAIAALTPGDVGIRVGEGHSAARYRVADPHALADVLNELAKARHAAGFLPRTSR